MPKWTERPASGASDFPAGTLRNLELSGTAGGDGAPLVVTVRAVPLWPLLEMRELIGADGAAPAERLGAYKLIARHGVVAPRFDFEGNGAGPPWDGLPLAAQVEIVTAIAELTTEGVEGAAAVAEGFRGGEPSG